MAYPLAHFMARKGKQLEPAVSDVSDASDSKPEDEELLTKNAQIEELENNLQNDHVGEVIDETDSLGELSDEDNGNFV